MSTVRIPEIDLRLGDCLDVLATLDDASVDAVVTDPPYGIGFMGHEWDQPGKYSAINANGEPGLDERVAPRRRTRQPAPSTGAGHATERAALSGGPTGIDNTTHTLRGGAMHAGRYDLSPSANRLFQGWVEAWASECLRVLKPGGHFVSFGGTRTYHRLAGGVEDAGFEIRDQLAWMFGSGFPKSLDVAKAIDRAAGERTEPVGTARMNDIRNGDYAARSGMGTSDVPIYATEPVTAAAAAGWGTALKPGYEPIVLARKPLAGTVAANVMEYGTGALNIDACRIATDDVWAHQASETGGRSGGIMGEPAPRDAGESHELGRWPANVALDEEAAAMLDEQTGVLVSGPESDRGHRRNADAEANRNAYGGFQGQEVTGVLYGDQGGASRFFYCPKVTGDERHQGLTKPSLFTTDAPDRNVHPTVKPIDLMRWLCRLITPAGGLIVDPFLGSGTTGIAAVLEGFSFLGIEREAEYMAIAQARISHWASTQVVAA